jgi:hypothetical protein
MIPASGPLGPIERKRRESRAGHRLPVCWEKVPGGGMSGARDWAAPPLASRLAPFRALAGTRGGEAADIFREGDSFLLVLAAQLPAGAVEEALRAAERGARVYVLASPGFGEGGLEYGLQQRRDARVLVRRLAGLPASCVFSQRGARSGLWLGASTGGVPRWWLPLSAAQGEALFRAMLHLFWHEAEEEAWTGGGPLRFQKALERPFDVPLPHMASPVKLVRPGPTSAPEQGDILHLPAGELPASGLPRPGLLFLPARAQGMEPLAALAREGTEVAWEDLGLPAFHGNARAAVLEPTSGTWTLRLELEPTQAGALHQLARLAAEHATWKLRTQLALADLRGEVWLPEAPTLQQRREEVELASGNVLAPELRQMPGCEPKQWAPPPELALNVTWRWKVQPPVQPPGAAEAPLVREWKQLDTDVARRLGTVKDGLARADQHSGFLSKTFAALAGPLLGFGRTRTHLAKEAEEAARQPPSALGPEGARALLASLAKLEADAGKLTDDLGQAEQKAREDQEREEQRKAYDQKRQAAEEKLSGLRRQLDELLPRLTAKQEEKRQADEELRKAPKEKEKDLKARAHLLSGEVFQLEKQRKTLESGMKAAEGTLKEEFMFRPSRPGASGSKNASTPTKGFIPEAPRREASEVPTEALPSTGRLMQHKNERYLVISRWEELPRAEPEAERLKARLVAPPEAA